MEKRHFSSHGGSDDPGRTQNSAAACRGPPTIQTALEDTNLDASSGNVGQESMGQEGDEVEKMSNLSLCLDMEAEAPRPQAAPITLYGRGLTSETHRGRKTAVKGGIGRKRKMVYLPCPLALRTPASSAAPVLGHAPVLAPLLEDDIEVSVEDEAWEQKAE